jgi:hypothetical protein
MRVLLIAAFALTAFSQNVLILTTEGNWLEGTTKLPARYRDALSMHNGAAASPYESDRIAKGLTALSGTDRALRDAAVEELTNLSLAALTPVLDALRDTNQQEPKPLYNLFQRLISSEADQLDRTVAWVRRTSGDSREAWPTGTIRVSGKDLDWGAVRMLAVRQKLVARRFELHALRHSTQIESLDSGVYGTAASRASLNARGFARLAFRDDSWACGPDGLSKPGGNYKTNLVDGHPFGALLGRVGEGGGWQFWGASARKTGVGGGRLRFAINDNRHWQNNLGAYTVQLTVTDAFDLGPAR